MSSGIFTEAQIRQAVEERFGCTVQSVRACYEVYQPKVFPVGGWLAEQASTALVPRESHTFAYVFFGTLTLGNKDAGACNAIVEDRVDDGSASAVGVYVYTGTNFNQWYNVMVTGLNEQSSWSTGDYVILSGWLCKLTA